MKRIIIIALFIVFLTTTPSSAFRCNCDIIAIGDHIYKILKKCGKPAYKEIIRKGESRPKVEHWIYGPRGGYYYCLVFSDGKLFKIETFR